MTLNTLEMLEKNTRLSLLGRLFYIVFGEFLPLNIVPTESNIGV